MLFSLGFYFSLGFDQGSQVWAIR